MASTTEQSDVKIENSYAFCWVMPTVPERIEAENCFLLALQWPGFLMQIPWPEGMTAEQAIEAWKRS